MIFSQLIHKISTYITLDKEDIDLIRSSFEYKSVPKGVTLIEYGKVTNMAFFITSGYMKYTKTIDSGKELIVHLYTPNNFATCLNSFFLGQRAEETLQTITDCEVLCITRSNLDKLYATNSKWQSFGRKLMEVALIEKEERVIDQLSLSAQNRYLKLMENQPDVIQNVPVKYIASFIGIEPESLSRIRKTN